MKLSNRFFKTSRMSRIAGVTFVLALATVTLWLMLGLPRPQMLATDRIDLASTSADSCTESNSYFNSYLNTIDFTECPSSVRNDQIATNIVHSLPAVNVQRRVQQDRKWSCTPKEQDVYISKACIQNSMMRRGPLATAKYYKCQDSDDIHPEVVAPPCVTPQFVQYMFNETNKVMACVNSGLDGGEDNDETLTPREVFGMLNRESLFMPNISYVGGIGVAQLIKHGAAQDFYMGPTGQMWNEIKNNAECAPFAKDHPNLLGDPNLVSKAVKGNINTCALLDIENNPSRSLVIGLAQYRAFKRQVLNRVLRKDKNKMTTEEYKSLNEKLTQAGYNAGLRRVYKAYGTNQNNPKHRVAAFSKTFQMGAFKDELARQYMKATNQTVLTPEAAKIIDWIFVNLSNNYDQDDDWQNTLLIDRKSVAKFMLGLRIAQDNPNRDRLLAAGQVIYNIVKTAPTSLFTYPDAIDNDLMKISKRKTQCELAGSP